MAGYNPVNEPGDVGGEPIGPFYQRLHDAIRAVDPDRILFLEGNRYSLDFDVFGDPWPNTVYTVRDYALPGLYDGGDYPGPSRGIHVDRDVIERTFLARTEYRRMRACGTSWSRSRRPSVASSRPSTRFRSVSAPGSTVSSAMSCWPNQWSRISGASFELARCVKREPLLDVVRGAIGADPLGARG